MYTHLLITFASERGALHAAEDLASAGLAQLERCIDDAFTAGCRRLLVDCSKVTSIRRPALLALSGAKKRLEARGGSLVITGWSPAFLHAAQRGGFPDLLGPGTRPTIVSATTRR